MINLNIFHGSNFLITGGTGLIGSSIVNYLINIDCNIRISLPVRDIEKARTVYNHCEADITFIKCDLFEYLSNITEEFDYIIHCASPTSGSYMIAHPVETYEFAVESTRKLLLYSKTHNVKSMIFVSSLEYYGQILDDREISEDMVGYINPISARSSYPLGKRAAEYLCTAYVQEFSVPVKIARLTQTFGPGVSKDDNRVFAQFARSIINNEDIILHTNGESAKPYCYTIDCVSAILYILLKGINGEAYNVANANTYISIKDMAEFLRDNFNPKIKVRIEPHPEMGYAPITKLRLSTEKLESLGWRPKYNLKQMFENLINSLRE